MIEQIFEKYGLRVKSFRRVHGGDINDAFEVSAGANRFFLKLNETAAYPEMFEKEAEGLNALRKAPIIKVPEVIGSGNMEGKQYLALEWLEKSGPARNSWSLLGSGIAGLHKLTSTQPGWASDNYIGSLVQSNTPQESWPLFYREQRVMPLLRRLFDSGAIGKADLKLGEKFCSKLEAIFPQEPYTLLHGDFWGGNFLMTVNGTPAIFDPAVYYGHREMDIGMSMLFGGFDKKFYEAYNEAYALERNWQQRIPVTQLYPLLVHAILFGSHYLGQSLSMMRAWI